MWAGSCVSVANETLFIATQPCITFCVSEHGRTVTTMSFGVVSIDNADAVGLLVLVAVVPGEQEPPSSFSPLAPHFGRVIKHLPHSSQEISFERLTKLLSQGQPSFGSLTVPSGYCCKGQSIAIGRPNNAAASVRSTSGTSIKRNHLPRLQQAGQKVICLINTMTTLDMLSSSEKMWSHGDDDVMAITSARLHNDQGCLWKMDCQVARLSHLLCKLCVFQASCCLGSAA